MNEFLNHKEVAILMATYNGEAYIEDQLKSILNQDATNWTLFIRDDGSTDKTVEILKNYSTNFDSIVLVANDGFKKGASGNFFSLLQMVDSQYYMFSDQDDVWLPDKVRKVHQRIKQLESLDTNQPIVIGTDLKVVDSHLNIIDESFWHRSKINTLLLTQFNYLAVCNGFTGCTMIINKLTRNLIIPTLPAPLMHDYWIALYVSSRNGILELLNSQTILYRQHEKNVVGSQKMAYAYWFSQIKNIKNVYLQNMCLYRAVNKICAFSIPQFLLFKLLYTLRR